MSFLLKCQRLCFDFSFSICFPLKNLSENLFFANSKKLINAANVSRLMPYIIPFWAIFINYKFLAFFDIFNKKESLVALLVWLHTTKPDTNYIDYKTVKSAY